jgi:hypothetical protein
MTPSQLKTQLSIDGLNITDQENLEIWVLLDKLARIEYDLYMVEKNPPAKAKQPLFPTLAIRIKMQHK